MKISYSSLRYMNGFKDKYILMNDREINLLRESFNKLFYDVNPFKDSFNSSVESKIIIYPTDGYVLTKTQFDAFCQVAISLGYESFYMSVVELEDFYVSEHFILDTSLNYTEYLKFSTTLENAIYMPNGELGILISHEFHGILGGSKESVEIFKDIYNYSSEDLNNFLDIWLYNKETYNSDISWIYDLIDRLSR